MDEQGSRGDTQQSSGVAFQSASAQAGLAKAQWLGCVMVCAGIPGLWLHY